MADGVNIPVVGPGVAKISAEEITTLNAVVVAAEQVQRLMLALRTADSTAVDLPGDGTFGLDVDVTRLPAVDLATATLAALENITVTVSNPSAAGGASEATLAAVLVAVAHGTYGYATGTAAATVDVPAGARVRRVSVLAGASVAATVAIAGGAAITVPAGQLFDEQIPGDATLGGDVVIGGTVQTFYVAWTV